MADSKAKPRKKPVRKAPVQKDYPTKLAWLQAMTEYETKQAEAETTAKVTRLDKRIATVQARVEVLTAQLHRLRHERNVLTGGEVEVELPEAEAETPSA